MSFKQIEPIRKKIFEVELHKKKFFDDFHESILSLR